MTVDEAELINNPELWLDHFGDYLYRHAYLRVGNRESAEDLVQETLLGAYRSIDSFEGRSSLRTWLLRILRYKTIDYFRKNKGDIESADLLDAGEERGLSGLAEFYAAATKSPEQQADFKQYLLAMEVCIANLPPKMREVLTLQVLDNLSNEEICKQLGVSSVNLRVASYRARGRLRKCLVKKGFDPNSF